ncbi:MAG: AraC family transcriptional regulator [Spirochaetes bacterium]|nr:AraC family transcriptional regulator [Spirochaetota bacterium]
MGRPSEILSRERLLLDFRGMGLATALHLGRLNYRRAHAPLARHRHAGSMEICYLVRGRQTYWVEDREHQLAAGDVFLTRPGEEHDTGGNPEERSILYWLLLDLSGPKTRFLHLRGQDARGMHRRLAAIGRRAFHAGEEAGRCLDRLVRLAEERDADGVRLSHEILSFLFLILDAAGREAPGSGSDLVARVARCVAERLDETVSVPDLAAACGLSLPQFKKRFRREAGMPPKEFVLRRRLERAQELLGDPRKSVTEIALETGFPSSQYFATVYRRFTGKRPRDGRAPG